MTAAQSESDASLLARLPKAELHLHLEGCITPELLIRLAEQHGEKLDYKAVAPRYQIGSFLEFLELFKWATSYLRRPSDYAQLAADALRELNGQNCRYAEITLSVGVMLLRRQNVEANLASILEAAQKQEQATRLQIAWIFDAVRQFGPEKAMEVARLAVQMKSQGVVAFGIGGDEESLPASDFHKVFDYAAAEGLHRVAHAGEMGGPQSIRDAIEILGAERIGHGISAIHDEKLMDLLIERQIPLEICPKSNLCTGALAKLLSVKQARIEDHPLPKFVARGVPVTLATDDPAMFRTSLNETYAQAASKMGLTTAQLVSIAEAGILHSFLPAAEKQSLLDHFRAAASQLSLL
ncbi:MAG TPA: adenosine deaminase [Candidatus Acidoferrales bacterium]|nr:adenosine deaminase [Candidatus Acidoferrales bacterium]